MEREREREFFLKKFHHDGPETLLILPFWVAQSRTTRPCRNAAVARRLPLHPVAARQPQEAPWRKETFVPFCCGKDAEQAMSLLKAPVPLPGGQKLAGIQTFLTQALPQNIPQCH